MRIVYMGTPDFAVAPLKSIYDAGHEVVGVYTQPDRQKGRGKKFLPSDVKVEAESLGLNVYQPEKLREADVVEELRALNPEMIVVAAYGQILSEEVLSIPKYGCVNIHASLLPKYRGASPIEASILSGDEKTGVTIMYMAKGLDTGDMISSAEIEIGSHNTETLTKELSLMGAELIVKAISDIENGTAERIPQNDAESSYAPKLDKAMGKMDFSETAESLERKIRGLYPWPCAFTTFNGKGVKILGARVEGENINPETAGQVVEVGKKRLVIGTGKGNLSITMLQPEGKKAMDVVSFLNGYTVQVGDRFE